MIPIIPKEIVWKIIYMTLELNMIEIKKEIGPKYWIHWIHPYYRNSEAYILDRFSYIYRGDLINNFIHIIRYILDNDIKLKPGYFKYIQHKLIIFANSHGLQHLYLLKHYKFSQSSHLYFSNSFL